MSAKLRTIGQKLAAPRRAKLRESPKKAGAIYLSAEWKQLMRQIISARGRRCEDRDHDPGRPREASRVFGDHIVELQDGGAPFEAANVLLRCGSCHTRKTLAERARRYRAAPT